MSKLTPEMVEAGTAAHIAEWDLQLRNDDRWDHEAFVQAVLTASLGQQAAAPPSRDGMPPLSDDATGHIRMLTGAEVETSRLARKKAAKAAAPGVGNEVVKLAVNALEEVEAILGGEYGNHYAHLCDTMMKLRAALAVAPPPQPDERLPCDVKVAPATTFRKGVPIATMLGPSSDGKDGQTPTLHFQGPVARRKISSRLRWLLPLWSRIGKRGNYCSS